MIVSILCTVAFSNLKLTRRWDRLPESRLCDDFLYNRQGQDREEEVQAVVGGDRHSLLGVSKVCRIIANRHSRLESNVRLELLERRVDELREVKSAVDVAFRKVFLEGRDTPA